MIRQSFLILACALLSACGQYDDGENHGPDDPTPSASAGAGPVVAAASPPPAFAICGSCHAIVPGGRGSGPSLAGVVGRKAGTLPGYTYSAALRGSGIVWTAQTLDTWLIAPMKMVPGTRMVIGVPDPVGRKAVIDYLETLK